MKEVTQTEFFAAVSYTENFRRRSCFGDIWYFSNMKFQGERRQDFNGNYTFWLQPV